MLFFVMSPEDAYQLLEAIAIISGTTSKLKRKFKEGGPTTKQTIKNPPIDFYKCGLKDGDTLVYIADPSITVKVSGNRKVLYNDELTSLSAIVAELKHRKKVQ